MIIASHKPNCIVSLDLLRGMQFVNRQISYLPSRFAICINKWHLYTVVHNFY